jgi:hypothetical protein
VAGQESVGWTPWLWIVMRQESLALVIVKVQSVVVGDSY